jgi:hypothetical protein
MEMSQSNKKPIILNEGESREMIIYRDGDNAPKVEVLLQQENLWLTQKAISTLFGVERSVITKHIKNIFDTSELNEDSVCAKIAHTAAEIIYHRADHAKQNMGLTSWKNALAGRIRKNFDKLLAQI